MNRKISLTALAIAVAVLCTVGVAPARAATVTVVTTLDVNDIQAGLSGWTGGVQNAPPFSPFSVDLYVGDTFDYTIDFLPGQELTIDNLSAIWAFSYADIMSKVEGTGALSLLGPTGAPLYTSNSKTDTEGDYHFGQFFYASDFPVLPASVTFAGLHYVGTVDQYLESGVTVRTYSDPALYFNADSYSNNSVPEPSSVLMLGTGLLVFGGTFKRKFFSARNRNL